MARRFNKKNKMKHTTKAKYKEIDGKFVPTKLHARRFSLAYHFEGVAEGHLDFRYRNIPNEITVTIIK